MAPQPSTWRGRSEQILLNPVGREAGKIPAEGDVFFLDIPLYRTSQDLVLGPQHATHTGALPYRFDSRSAGLLLV